MGLQKNKEGGNEICRTVKIPSRSVMQLVPHRFFEESVNQVRLLVELPVAVIVQRNILPMEKRGEKKAKEFPR